MFDFLSGLFGSWVVLRCVTVAIGLGTANFVSTKLGCHIGYAKQGRDAAKVAHWTLDGRVEMNHVSLVRRYGI